jgi:2'-5' RNA ligase
MADAEHSKCFVERRVGSSPTTGTFPQFTLTDASKPPLAAAFRLGRMARLVVVLPLEPLQVGERFAVHHWPLHVTVLAPFTTHASPDEVAEVIGHAINGQRSIRAVAGHDELFGRRHDVPVTVLVPNHALDTLHRTLVDAVRPYAASEDEPAFRGSGFRPHVTVKSHGRVLAGDRMLLEQLAVVDMSPRSDPRGRSVLAVSQLGDD